MEQCSSANSVAGGRFKWKCQGNRQRNSRGILSTQTLFFGVFLKIRTRKGGFKNSRELGFLKGYSEGSNPTYSKVNQDLLVELGIEGILERIVVPKVTNGFAPEVLRYFRRCWEQGQTPDMKYLKERKLYRRHIFAEDKVYDGREPRVVGHKDPAHLFVQIDTQHNFVERWTVFAGLWFEEIEPLFGSVREGISEVN